MRLESYKSEFTNPVQLNFRRGIEKCSTYSFISAPTTMILRQESSDVAEGGLQNGFVQGGLGGLHDESIYDVVVVGGGMAGIGAAIGARQASPSSRVLIVESEGCLGGAATHRGVLSFCGLYSVEPVPRRAVGSIWDDLHRRLVEQGAARASPDKIVSLVQVNSTLFRGVRSLLTSWIRTLTPRDSNGSWTN